ncbi:Retrovirus-related Pol polyprotein from transposon RE2 [Vitis vinifera]|uniref:Retrovirus-related Pol polyprotein from transposon RE2 n=1 Tax=Vitis vinifera TaxID=29760 RepID=A0A438CSZ3_VITVI|nr:Retrovirus-related Pol polyprotein from transposon RE2 [Vitis vinifera]
MATSSSDSFPIAINATQQITARLTPTNFPSWCAQFESLLLGYNLFGYVDGTHTCPPLPTSTDAAATTAHHLWTRVMQLKEDLTLMQRGNRNITEYLHSVKTIADELALIDAPLSQDDITLDQIFVTLLPPIRARESSLSFEELHDLLLGHEAYLRRLDSTAQSLSKQYKYPPRCQYCDQQGHIAKYCPKLKPSEATMNCTTTTSSPDKRWLIDSTASIISLLRFQIYNFTLNMMVLMKLLLEMDQVCPLLIPILLLFHFQTENFKLKILCVPTINKNLISVHHFTKQNNVILEFHPTYFLVKDRRTGEIFLQGPCENGVYPLPSSPVATPIAFVHERTSVAGWH